jgi:hypothetical protein
MKQKQVFLFTSCIHLRGDIKHTLTVEHLDATEKGKEKKKEKPCSSLPPLT